MIPIPPPAMLAVDWWALGPILALTTGACLLLLLEFVPWRAGTGRAAVVSLLALLAAGYSVFHVRDDRRSLFGGMFVHDGLTVFFTLLLCSIAVVGVLLSWDFVRRIRMHLSEYYALLLFSTIGMITMAASNDLVTIFLGLELMSLPLYVLVGIRRGHLESNEASLKYFLLGAFASGFLLYGIALLFGATGTTNLTRMAAFLGESPLSGNPLFWVGTLLVLVGFGFKVSVVPFHMWTPDAYEGAPTIVTAFMSTGVKAAAFAAFVRVFLAPLEPLKDQWVPVLAVIAGATMILGTVVGVVQTNVKRMLAYSSIAHAGYLLLGLIATTATGKAAVLFYLLSYAVTNLGALGIVALLGTPQHEHDELRDFAGLWKSRPGLAGLMTVFLLSLGGFPPTAGFIGKWYIFAAAVERGYYWLAIIGVLTSVVSVFFYLRIVVMMYMTEGSDAARPRVPAVAVAGLAMATLAVLYLGVLPTRLIDLALDSIATIF
jgi:NADH-quinone oxidoreductase subunit N